jgi:hypothetical protein
MKGVMDPAGITGNRAISKPAISEKPGATEPE